MTTEQKIIWDDEASRIDKEVINTYIGERNWEQYIPKGEIDDSEDFRAFCRHLVYVISKFLEEEDSRELFIELPIEEFTNNDRPTLQSSRWKQVAESIMTNLRLATARSMYERTFLQNPTPTNEGDKFLLYDNGGHFH